MTQRVIGVKKERGPPPPMMVVVVASAVFGSSISGLRKKIFSIVYAKQLA